MTTPAITPDQNQQPPQAPNIAPPTPAPAQPPQRTGAFDKVLEALGGGPNVSYKVDPDTGKQVATQSQPSRGQLAKHIIAGALTGLFSGLAEHGPGAAGRAGAEGFNASAQAAQRADAIKRQQSEQDFENQQKVLTQKAQIYDANQRAYLTHVQARSLDLQYRNDLAAHSQILSQPFEEAGYEKVGEHLTDDEIHDLLQKGQLSATAHTYFQDGETDILGKDGKPVMDEHGVPETQPTFTAYHAGDPTKPVQIKPEVADAAAKYGLPVPAGVSVSGSGYSNMASRILNLDSVWGNVKTVRGETPDDAELQKDPQVRSALEHFSKYLAAYPNNPLKAVQAMGAEKQVPSKDPANPQAQTQTNPDARFVPWVLKAYGGPEKLQSYADKVEAQSAKAKKEGEGQAEVETLKAKGPIETQQAVNKQKALAPGEISLAKQKAAAEEQGRAMATEGMIGKADTFGNPIGGPGVDIKEFRKRYDSFSKDNVAPLRQLDKTNEEFTRIMNDPHMTGAEKVTGLLGAVGISFDPLKGKGARINNDVINEHANARSVWETASQKANTIFGSGGPITANQIKDYANIARGVVHDAYVSSAREAERQGLPVDFLPKGGGRPADNDTIRIYVDVAGGDPQKATQALQAAGWK